MRRYRPLRAAIAGFFLLLVPLLAEADGARRARTVASFGERGLVLRAFEWLQSVWLKEGCRIDPSGGCFPNQGLPIHSEKPEESSANQGQQR